MTYKLPDLSLLDKTVPLSRFDGAESRKILDEVKTSGCAVVTNDDSAECVILSMERYKQLLDVEGGERPDAAAPKHTTAEDIMSRFGITEAELEDIVDDILCEITEERLLELERGETKLIPAEEIWAKYGITQEMMEEMEDVELEYEIYA